MLLLLSIEPAAKKVVLRIFLQSLFSICAAFVSVFLGIRTLILTILVRTMRQLGQAKDNANKFDNLPLNFDCFTMAVGPFSGCGPCVCVRQLLRSDDSAHFPGGDA